MVNKRPGGERDDSRSIGRRVDWMEWRLGMPLDDVQRAIAELREHEKDLLPLSRFHFDPGIAEGNVDEDIVLLGGGKSIEVPIRAIKTSELVRDYWSWGLTERTVSVESAPHFGFATLRFRLSSEHATELLPKSILVCRWEPVTGRYSPVPASGYNSEGGYAFARITRGGQYTAIGVAKTPDKLAVLLRLNYLNQVLRGDEVAARLSLARDVLSECMGAILRSLSDGPNIRTVPHAIVELFDLEARAVRNDLDISMIEKALDRVPELAVLRGMANPNALETDPTAFPEAWPDKPLMPTCYGPDNFAGRITAVVSHPKQDGHWYAATAGGGVWKTTDAGATWRPTMDDGSVGCLAIGGLEISPSNPEVLYAATGEWTGGTGRDVSIVAEGGGVYKSVNGGECWTVCGPVDFKFASVVRISQSNNEHVFVGSDTGLYESTCGGREWKYVNPPSSDAVQVSDALFDPLDPNTIYVAFHLWGVARMRLNLPGIWEVVADLFDSPAPKIAFQAGAADQDRLLVKVNSAVLRVTRNGELQQLSLLPSGHGTDDQYSWASMLAAHPIHRDLICAGDLECWAWDEERSRWYRLSSTRPGMGIDQQQLIFLPPKYCEFLLANDRGVYRGQVSKDGHRLLALEYVGKDIVASHFYSVAVPTDGSGIIGGTMQDCDGQLRTRDGKWCSIEKWEHGFLMAAPAHQGLFFHTTSQAPYLNWFVFEGENITDCDRDIRIRPDWKIAEPLALPTGTADRMLLIAQVLGDASESRNALFRFQVEAQPASEPYPVGKWQHTLQPAESASFAAVICEPKNGNIAYVADNKGSISISVADRDHAAGGTWKPVDSEDRTTVPPSIATLAVDWKSPCRIYVTGNDIDRRWMAWRGDIRQGRDGASIAWTDISCGRDSDSISRVPVFALIAHPELEGVLFAGTAAGLMLSRSGGETWEIVPTVPKVAILDVDTATESSKTSLWCASMGRGLIHLPL